MDTAERDGRRGIAGVGEVRFADQERHSGNYFGDEQLAGGSAWKKNARGGDHLERGQIRDGAVRLSGVRISSCTQHRAACIAWVLDSLWLRPVGGVAQARWQGDL